MPWTTSTASWRPSGLQVQLPRLMTRGPDSGPGTGSTRSLPRARSRTRRAGRFPALASQASLEPSGETASPDDSAVPLTLAAAPPAYGTR
jgi:hypothetical protein